MGVELRTIQRKFHSLMGEIQPSIRPCFVVWLDERLAEFKIKGHMDLSETLDDPQWLKSYYTSKREAKAAAILKHEAKNATSSDTDLIHTKVEAQSESSNGLAHPDEIKGLDDNPEVYSEECAIAGTVTEEQPKSAEESVFQLVEVKQEHLKEEEDDMIIVGETTYTPNSQSYSIQNNPHLQIYPGYGRNAGFQRKRQRFSTFPQAKNTLSGHRFKSRMKHTIATSDFHRINEPYPSHTVTSQSVFPSMSLSQAYQSEPIMHPDTSSHIYESGDQSTSLDQSLPLNTNESLRLPPQLQAQADELDFSEGGYGGDEGEMYTEYGDESYDSSYVTDPAETSLQFDEEGNAVLKGEHYADKVPVTSIPNVTQGGRSQESFSSGLRIRPFDFSSSVKPSPNKESYQCLICWRSFKHRSNLRRHIRFDHLKTSSYTCDMCLKPFVNKDNLEGHLNSVHYNIRPHICACGKQYYCRRTLLHHAKSCRPNIDTLEI